MSATIFNGKEFAKKKEERLMGVLRDLRDIDKVPKLSAILIGDNPESRLYLKLKEKKAIQLGINFEFHEYIQESPQQIIDFIEKKNVDPTINGIVIELPLPEKFVIGNFKHLILNTIDSAKDVDCLTNENLSLLEKGKPKFIPPTVKAVGEIIKEALGKTRDLGFLRDLREMKFVVVGSKGEVGKAVLSYLGNMGDIKYLCGIDKETADISLVTKTADVLISCTGIGLLVKKEMVKKGAIVIDVGIEKQPDGKLVGDVDFEQVKEIASFITPVPGGVGPVTVVSLMENLVANC